MNVSLILVIEDDPRIQEGQLPMAGPMDVPRKAAATDEADSNAHFFFRLPNAVDRNYRRERIDII